MTKKKMEWPILHPILKDWLAGTSCHHYNTIREVLFENDTHIVLKHGSHADYQDRVAGSVCCKSYAELYDKTTFNDSRPAGRTDSQNLLYGRGAIKLWEGRINKHTVRDDCSNMGIYFK